MFDSVYKNKKVIDSHSLNEFVTAKFGKEYSCAKGADASQDSFRKYDIDNPELEGGEWWFPTEDSLEDHRAFLAKWEGYDTSPDPGVILNELLLQGDILAGEYVLLISW